MTHVQKETAVLLKEKGFNVPTDYFYAYSEGDMTISAPTLHEAADWLREKKGVHVYVKPQWSTEEWFGVVSIYAKNRYTENFKTHDEALEAGIVHALKHYVK